jgi:GNAT superfamily N-acetyltransferase
MNLDELRTLYDQDQRINILYPGIHREATPHVVRHIDLSGVYHAILYSSLSDENADSIIRQEIAYFQQLGGDVEWKLFSHDKPQNLKERLAGQGFEVGELEAILVLLVEEAPSALLQPVTHEIRRMTSADEIRQMMAVQTEVEGEDHSWLADLLIEEWNTSPEQLGFYAAYADDKIVSSSWVRFPGNSLFASLWGGATLAPYRGRGFYSALLAVRVQEAVSRGRRFLTVDASPMSRPILEKFGFRWIADSYPCLWHANKT